MGDTSEYQDVLLPRIRTVLLLFRQILPVAQGHVFPLLHGVAPLLDGDGAEIGLPQRLVEPFVFIHPGIVQPPGGQGGAGAVVCKADLAHLLQVVVIAVGAPHVVEQPALAGKAVFEVVDDQGKGVFLGLYGSKVSAVGHLLEADKLKQAQAFPIHPLPHAGEGQHVGIAKVGLNGARGIDRLADISEQKGRGFRLFGQPTLRQGTQGEGRKLLLQAAPHAGGLGLIGRYREDLLMKQGQRTALGQQHVGKRAPGVGLEHRGQQPFKGIVKVKDYHPDAPPPSLFEVEHQLAFVRLPAPLLCQQAAYPLGSELVHRQHGKLVAGDEVLSLLHHDAHLLQLIIT